MKTKLLWLLVLATQTFNAQIQVNTQWANDVNEIFEDLDKSRIPHGILLDYAMEFIDVPSYNGQLTETQGPFTYAKENYVDVDVIGNIYKTLYMGKVDADTTNYPQLKNYAQHWYQERLSYNATAQNTLVLGGLFYHYSRIKETARDNNEITVSPFQQKYADKYINGVWQNPYETLATVAIAPPVSEHNKRSFEVVFPAELFLSNSSNQLQVLQIDFQDGQGFRNIAFDTPITVTYARNNIYTWTYRLLLTGRRTLESQSKIKIDAPDIKQERVSFQRNIPSAAAVTLDIAPVNNGVLTRPLIVVEGFDAGSILTPEEEGGDTTLLNFATSLNNIGQLSDLISPNADAVTREYDIVYIDWINGTAPLQDNSEVLEEVINWVNTTKVGDEPNVLLGQSMGGLIGRYTLARMEQDGLDHDVRLFIAHDSPMQGANTPISIQHLSRHIHNEYISAPIAQILGEGIIPLVANITDFFINFANNNFNEDFNEIGFISPNALLTIQDTPAAVQLNYQWVDLFESPTTSIHDNWQQAFDQMGYPTQSRNIAISNGNECAAPQRNAAINPVGDPLLPGDQLVDILDLDNPDFFGDLVQMLTTPVIGAIFTDPELIILGVIPGSSEWEFDFNIYAVPNTSDPDRNVYNGSIKYTKKLLWLVDIPYTLTSRSKDAPSGYFPYGSYTGGQSPSILDILTDNDGDLILPLSVDIINDIYGFIPVASALDVRRGTDLPNAFDHQRTYGGGIVDFPGLNTEFDNFIVDYNEGLPLNNEHISFQVRNGNWLADELNEIPDGAFADCRILCNSEESIQGEDALCTTGLYFIDINPVGVTTDWSVSDTDAVTIVNETDTDVTLSAVSGNRTTITLTAVIEIPDCDGMATLTREIRVGRPGLPASISGPSEVDTGALVTYTAGSSEGSTSYKWRLPHVFETVQQFDLFGDAWQLRLPGDTFNEQVFTGYGEINGLVQVSGMNACGEGGARSISVTHVTGGDGGVALTDNGDDNNSRMMAYPNPTINLLMIEPKPQTGRQDVVEINDIKVYDSTFLEQRIPDYGDGKTYAELDLSNLRRGVYFVEIITGEGVEVKKVIVN